MGREEDRQTAEERVLIERATEFRKSVDSFDPPPVPPSSSLDAGSASEPPPDSDD